MIIEKDDEKSSGIAMPKKRYATTFEGAHIQTLILGDGVFERVDKLPEEVLYPHRERTAPKTETMKNEFIITREKIGRCILAVQKYFWGSSCYAILYCVLRDRFGHKCSMTSFEDDVNMMSEELDFNFNCPNNTLAITFCRNRYLKTHTDKWRNRGVMKRAVKLADDFTEAINNQK